MTKKLKSSQVLLLMLGSMVALTLAMSQSPETLDILGLATFSFLIYLGNRLIKRRGFPNNLAFLVFGIGVIGIIIDGMIVLKTYGGLG